MREPPGVKRPSRNQANGNAIFDPKIFLAQAGLGKKLVKLKKSEAAFAQGDPADAIFYVQKGRLRVTVTSTNGKEATITLVGPGEFVGENCMVSAHPLHLATATAMTDCELLKIGKEEMVRELHDEPKLSDMFVQSPLTRIARIQDDLSISYSIPRTTAGEHSDAGHSARKVSPRPWFPRSARRYWRR